MAHGEVGIPLVDRPPDPTINAHCLAALSTAPQLESLVRAAT